MQWKQSDLFPDYDVSEYGDVRRNKPDLRGRILVDTLRPRLDRGYKKYRLYRDGEQRQVKACLVVISAFVGPKPFDRAEVCHRDGNSRNDHYSNLRWDSHKGNHADTITHGTRSRGERHGLSKLTECDVLAIRKLAAKGASGSEIAKRFGISPRYARNLARGGGWQHLT